MLPLPLFVLGTVTIPAAATNLINKSAATPKYNAPRVSFVEGKYIYYRTDLFTVYIRRGIRIDRWLFDDQGASKANVAQAVSANRVRRQESNITWILFTIL